MLLGFCVETATFVTRRFPALPQPTRAANNNNPNGAPSLFGSTGTEHTLLRTPVEQLRSVNARFPALFGLLKPQAYGGGMRLFLIVACVTLAAGTGGWSDPEPLARRWLPGPGHRREHTAGGA